MDPGSLLKAIMGPVEVKILLSLGGWLSHGQSCHISYFYKILQVPFHSRPPFKGTDLYRHDTSQYKILHVQNVHFIADHFFNVFYGFKLVR